MCHPCGTGSNAQPRSFTTRPAERPALDAGHLRPRHPHATRRHRPLDTRRHHRRRRTRLACDAVISRIIPNGPRDHRPGRQTPSLTPTPTSIPRDGPAPSPSATYSRRSKAPHRPLSRTSPRGSTNLHHMGLLCRATPPLHEAASPCATPSPGDIKPTPDGPSCHPTTHTPLTRRRSRSATRQTTTPTPTTKLFGTTQPTEPHGGHDNPKPDHPDAHRDRHSPGPGRLVGIVTGIDRAAIPTPRVAAIGTPLFECDTRSGRRSAFPQFRFRRRRLAPAGHRPAHDGVLVDPSPGRGLPRAAAADLFFVSICDLVPTRRRGWGMRKEAAGVAAPRVRSQRCSNTGACLEVTLHHRLLAEK